MKTEQNNKENVPPFCNTMKAKFKKSPISQKAKIPSFKSIGNGIQRKPKRIPLSDITDLFNNSSTFTISHHHRQINDLVSEIPSVSISRWRAQVASPSKSLRMGFR
ncbi:hypothetical protein TanjilG_19679 [Lupinus angustifolius]|uniref:Uncharacterized protein n=1 Tax=Lupinus angustifolius TaxID=3871 RepID=A0A1J7GFH3_LUPAN|nr:hypothetical protein TanjilG_19679 [Lupinus angustifolius]